MASIDMGVQTKHPEYVDKVDDWNFVDNIIAAKVKQYLRNVGESESDTDDAERRQREYEDGAVFHNFTLNTRNGMQGAIFRRDPEIELPDSIKYLLDDVDGNGMTLVQQAQDAVDQDLRKGRAGFFVDMPAPPLDENGNPIALSKAQMASEEMGPRIQLYPAQDIINWRTERFGSVSKLSMVVLRETYEKAYDDDGFYFNIYFQYRKLGLDEQGYYEQVYRSADGDENDVFVGGDIIRPRQNGSAMDHIPFYFVGSENNDYTCDSIPLLPISTLNAGHYRNSADTEENSFVASQAMLVINLTGMDVSAFNEANPKGIKAGARRGLIATDAKYIQASDSDKAMKLMEMKEQQAIQIGAQLITPSIQITAESARIQSSANTSVLSSIAHNVSAAYQLALNECQLFRGSSSEIIFKLNQDFFMSTMTAQDRAQWMAEINMGVMPASSYYAALRRAGMTDKTDDDLKDEIESNPIGMV